jgi:hypothetical protein
MDDTCQVRGPQPWQSASLVGFGTKRPHSAQVESADVASALRNREDQALFPEYGQRAPRG